MTLSRRLAHGQEKRSMMAGWPSGQSMIDPAAIPPPGMQGSTHAGMLVTPHTAMTIDVVHTALSVITSGVLARGNLRAYTEEINPTSGLPYRQWSSTEPQFLTNTFAFAGPASNSQSRGRMQTTISLALFGESWWHILTRDRFGYASSVQVLHPALLVIKTDTAGNVSYQYRVGAGQYTVLDPADLYHIERTSMPQSERALSNIEYASVVYGIGLAAQEYTSLWFAQGASPGFLLTAEQDIGEEVAQRISQRFRVEHSGLRQSHIPIVTGQGLQVQQTGVNADDAQMLQTFAAVRESIAAMFLIPSHLIGGANDKGNVWGTDAEEVAQSMETFTYAPYVVPLEEAHSDLLGGGVSAAFANSLVKPNTLNLGNALQFMRQAQVITPNEARAMYLGLPPHPDGDDLITPLASNTSPDQTNTTAQDAAKPPEPTAEEDKP